MNTATLILMRHAKSDWDTGAGSDFDRPLSRRGIRDAGLMGQWLNKTAQLPELVIASPALRARQTVECLSETAGLEVEKTVWEKSIYNSGMRNLLDIAKQYFDRYQTLMLVGHNPAMEELLHYLSDTDVPATAAGKIMTTANIALFSLNRDDEDYLQAGSGTLLAFARPKEIEY